MERKKEPWLMTVSSALRKLRPGDREFKVGVRPSPKTKQDKNKQTELVQNNSMVSKDTVAHLRGVWRNCIFCAQPTYCKGVSVPVGLVAAL